MTYKSEKKTFNLTELDAYLDSIEKADESVAHITHIKAVTGGKDTYLIVKKKKTAPTPTPVPAPSTPSPTPTPLPAPQPPTASTGVKILSDLTPVPSSAPPALPKAGGKFKDPFFGTEIMRVTDETDGDCGTAYSYWSTLNADNTLILVQNYKGWGHVRRFDPVNFALGARIDIPPLPGMGATLEDACFSAKSPNRLFMHSNARIVTPDISSGLYTEVGDLTNRFPAGTYFWQMSVSRDDDVFAFNLKRGDGEDCGYAVWKRSTNTLLLKSTDYVNEVQIDKTGRFLVVRTGDQGAGRVEARVCDLQTGVAIDLLDDLDKAPGGHSDMGAGSTVGDDNWTNGITFRRLDNPKAFTNLISFGSDWTMDKHVSFLKAGDDFALVSTFKGGGKPFNNEIFLVKADGSGVFRRFLSHYSVYREYNDSPRANISRDGRFVAFTSNFGAATRSLFIARVPAEAYL